ncbi:hypothetical protein NPIL_507911 [Nephila pilipes]|uniref:Uncharacterized protein n=1 Tax=Nephila pilipes TaxID=299642 RepID=A0A8X6N523_NEPPI|nr:hypothetical protein NPIL_507911 [Nephila pilipes]
MRSQKLKQDKTITNPKEEIGAEFGVTAGPELVSYSLAIRQEWWGEGSQWESSIRSVGGAMLEAVLIPYDDSDWLREWGRSVGDEFADTGLVDGSTYSICEVFDGIFNFFFSIDYWVSRYYFLENVLKLGSVVTVELERPLEMPKSIVEGKWFLLEGYLVGQFGVIKSNPCV